MSSLELAIPAMLLFGASMGCIDVVVNIQTVLVEKYCGLQISGDYEYSVKILQGNYESIGIRFTAHDNKPNEYYDKREEKQVSRLSALQMLIDFGHRNGRYGR